MGEVKLLGKKENTVYSSTPGFESVGQILKYYRELKGLSLEEVSKRTYIKLKYLDSLEENIQDVMPAPVYVYSYIKHYAKLLGLEGAELVKLYQKQCNINDSGLVSEVEDNEVKDNPEIESLQLVEADTGYKTSPAVKGILFSEETEDNNIYLQNKNIIELSGKEINKDNGTTLMDLDAIFDNNTIAKPAKIEAKPAIPPVKQENTALTAPKAEKEMPKTEAKIITQDIITSTMEADRIIREAKKQAERIIKDAQEEAYELRAGAQTYADSVLKTLEQELSASVAEIKNGRAYLRNKNL